jgi:uncharacterized phage-associated protein
VPHALSVAKEFVRLSFAGNEPDPLTNLRLQKLLYYAQAWSLVARACELFPEELMAWRHGPVVREVYRSLSDREDHLIGPEAFAGAADLPLPEAELVRAVWDAYKRFSATQLWTMTHREPPWKKAWGGRPKDAAEGNPISLNDMDEYFANVAVPAPLARYEHALREAEKRAAAEVAAIPPFGADRLAPLAVTHAPPPEWLDGD